jgi:hypothetical protein
MEYIFNYSNLGVALSTGIAFGLSGVFYNLFYGLTIKKKDKEILELRKELEEVKAMLNSSK